RDGFELTDRRMTRRQVLGQTHYCLLCHEREKDSCSKGFFDEKTNTFQKNPLGVALPGCPLDEKISEMHQLRREGDSIGALALILNEGFGVVGIDGLKIEPQPADWTGADGNGVRAIRDWSEIEQPLSRRPLAGFGGVSEYGITVRWDKNFLTLLHVTLARRTRF